MKSDSAIFCFEVSQFTNSSKNYLLCLRKAQWTQNSNLMGQWDGSVEKVIDNQAWLPRLNPQDSQGRRRKLTPQSCPLTCLQAMACIPMHLHASKIKIPLSSFCIGKQLGGMGPALLCGWYSQWHAIEENWFSLCQWLSIVDNFLFRGGTPSGLNLCSLVHRASLCESICASAISLAHKTVPGTQLSRSNPPHTH